MCKWIKGLVSLAIVVLVLPVLGACASTVDQESPAATEQREEMVIGILEDLSGPQAGLSNEIRAGYLDGIRYLNEDKSGISGHKVREITVDHRFDSTLINAGWDRMMGEGTPLVFSVLGGLPAIATRGEQDHIPIIAGSGATMDLLFPKERNYLFAQTVTLPGAVGSAFKMIEKDWAEKGKTGSPRIGMDVVPLGMQKTLVTKATILEMEKRGWEYIITNTQMVPLDVSTQVLKMKDFGCDYIFTVDSEAGSIAWLKELDRQDFHPVIFAHTNMGSPEIWNAVGELSLGARVIQMRPYWDETNFPLIQLLRDLNAKWNPEVTSQPSYYIAGFASTLLMTEAMERAINSVGYENLNGQAVADALETIDDLDIGMGINYIYTPTDHRGLHGVRWYYWAEGGKMAPLMTEWDIVPPLPEEQRSDAWWMKN